MSKEVKENGHAWAPDTPANQQKKNAAVGKRKRVPRKTRKAETNNGNTTDDVKMKGTDDVGTSSRKTRPKMKRHRPKVVNENKPIKPKTPEQKTPKPPGQVRKKVGKAKKEPASRRKLKFNKESSPVNDEFGIAGGQKIFKKKKRKMRKRMSLAKLIRLIGMINDKLCNCESTTLTITWIHLRRKRSRMTRPRRKEFIRKASPPQVEDAHNKPVVVVEQCEHPQDNSDFQQQKEDSVVDLSDELVNVLSYKDDAVQAALVDYATQRIESLSIHCDGSEENNNQLAVVVGNKRPKKLVVLGPKNQNVDENMQLAVVAPRRRRAKVDTDEETVRVWDLFIRGVEDTEENDKKERKTRLDEEREIFVARVDSFIDTMFLLSGDRRFTRWKGSVVDSVVGVFLTQNVSDNLSSNAFMDLAARYPPPSLREQNFGGGAIDYIVHEPDSPRSQVEEIHSHFSMTKAITVDMGASSSAATKSGMNASSSSETKVPPGRKNKKEHIKNGDEDWDDFIKRYSFPNSKKRGEHNIDAVDWKAVREAPLVELAKVIERRGMNYQLAERIKNFLDLLVIEHGGIDLEWLRNVPPLEAKSYLMSIAGMGLKSTECVRLLSLYQPAFPIDVNVARVLVRLGWVKLKPLPEGLQIHLLNDYPELSSVQEYIWPRICKRDEQTLYELHCYMNIFSKAFCTKLLPNCKACPMREECKHYASIVASSRLPIQGSQAKNETTSECNTNTRVVNQERWVIEEQHVLDEDQTDREHDVSEKNHCEPILEFPESPEREPLGEEEEEEDIEDFESLVEDFGITQPLGGDIEDFGGESEIQTIILNINQMSENLLPTILNDNGNAGGGISRDLVPQFAQIPLPKIKNVKRLRTEHTVYELPDSHPLLSRFQRRDPKDPCPYLLAIWTSDSCQEPKKSKSCDSQESSTSEAIVQYREMENVKGTLLIPCRTANDGRFPLNGTYFQINEVFADHDSSQVPIDVPRKLIWNLQKRTLYCGTTITSICRGMTLKDIVYCFRKGYICIRGIDLNTRRPRLLMERFHLCKTRQKVDE